MYTTGFMGLRLFDGSYTEGGVYIGSLAAHLRPSFDAIPAPWSVSVKSLVLTSSLSTAFIAHYNGPKFFENLRDRSSARFSTVTRLSFGVAAMVGVPSSLACALPRLLPPSIPSRTLPPVICRMHVVRFSHVWLSLARADLE